MRNTVAGGGQTRCSGPVRLSSRKQLQAQKRPLQVWSTSVVASLSSVFRLQVFSWFVVLHRFVLCVVSLFAVHVTMIHLSFHLHHVLCLYFVVCEFGSFLHLKLFSRTEKHWAVVPREPPYRKNFGPLQTVLKGLVLFLMLLRQEKISYSSFKMERKQLQKDKLQNMLQQFHKQRLDFPHALQKIILSVILKTHYVTSVLVEDRPRAGFHRDVIALPGMSHSMTLNFYLTCVKLRVFLWFRKQNTQGTPLHRSGL
ncbi:hypothetical protein NL108_008230 [Boleophthalmus pectinirostris]|nr:hypothetical protein NL108_008230 [Boleophthalmus pectinirostris]